MKSLAGNSNRVGRSDLEALCRRVGARFGSEVEAAGGPVWPTGLAEVDRLAGGGLPPHALSEVVEAAPSAGATLLLHRLLDAVPARQTYAALVDGADGFAPEEAGAEVLRQLYWVRCREAGEALREAELLAADGNFGLLLLDLRGSDPAALRRVPGRRWHRLQRMVRKSGCTCVGLTPEPLVAAATVRLRLARSFGFAALAQPTEWPAEQVVVEPLRAGRRVAES